ncbi:MAG: RNA polymerase sigma factor [Planctomycetota bacterium]
MAADAPRNEDQHLLRRVVRSRDSEALGWLYARYYTRIKRYIAVRVACIEDAEDLAQSVFLELCKGNDHGDPKKYKNAEAYLFGIARNFIGQYRRNSGKQFKTIPLGWIEEIVAKGEMNQQQEAAELLSPQELRKRIEDAVSLLPPKARQALRLRLTEGYSTKQAAQKAECSIWTFYKRLDKAVRVLDDSIKK